MDPRPRRLVTLAVLALLVAPVASALTTDEPTSTTVGPRTPSPPIQDRVEDAGRHCLTEPTSTCTQPVLREIRAIQYELATTAARTDGLTAWLERAAGYVGLEVTPLERPTDPDGAAALTQLYEDLDIGETPDPDHLQTELERTPPSERPALDRLLWDVATAQRLVHEATQALPNHVDRTYLEQTMQLGSEIFDPATTAPSAEQITEWNQRLATIEQIDRDRLATASLLLADATTTAKSLNDTRLDLPFIHIGHPGPTNHTEDYMLHVDVSGNDTYNNHAGAPLIGDDRGIGLTIDLGDADDRYTKHNRAQGYAAGGVGILHDAGGNDWYNLTGMGQGSANAGIAILYDEGNGADVYHSPQRPDDFAARWMKGHGGLGGIGLLVDEGGPDHLRDDGIDSFIYGAAGGLGLLANLGPAPDTYISLEEPNEDRPPFAGPIQVSAEAGGGAILFEEGGDDTYVCGPRVRQGCQGAGGPNSLALLLEQGGDDTYTMGTTVISEVLQNFIFHVPYQFIEEYLDDPPRPDATGTFVPMGQGAGYGVTLPVPGTGVGVLYDGAGNDIYTAEKWAQGYGGIGSLGFLFDLGGEDTYDTAPPLTGERTDGGAWVDGFAGVGIDR